MQDHGLQALEGMLNKATGYLLHRSEGNLHILASASLIITTAIPILRRACLLQRHTAGVLLSDVTSVLVPSLSNKLHLPCPATLTLPGCVGSLEGSLGCAAVTGPGALAASHLREVQWKKDC